MKLLSKILGILSFIVTLVLLGLLIYGFTQASTNDLWILALLTIPLYALIHFIVLHRFGFNYNSPFNRSQAVSVLVLSFIICATFIGLGFHQIVKYIRLNSAITWSNNSTLNGFQGTLITKYDDERILYQFDLLFLSDELFVYDNKFVSRNLLVSKYGEENVTIEFLNQKGITSFSEELRQKQVTFSINFYDSDGFFIINLEIPNYQNTYNDNGNFKGVNTNSSATIEFNDYQKISKWELVTSLHKNFDFSDIVENKEELKRVLPPPPKK